MRCHHCARSLFLPPKNLDQFTQLVSTDFGFDPQRGTVVPNLATSQNDKTSEIVLNWSKTVSSGTLPQFMKTNLIKLAILLENKSHFSIDWKCLCVGRTSKPLEVHTSFNGEFLFIASLLSYLFLSYMLCLHHRQIWKFEWLVLEQFRSCHNHVANQFINWKRSRIVRARNHKFQLMPVDQHLHTTPTRRVCSPGHPVLTCVHLPDVDRAIWASDHQVVICRTPLDDLDGEEVSRRQHDALPLPETEQADGVVARHRADAVLHPSLQRKHSAKHDDPKIRTWGHDGRHWQISGRPDWDGSPYCNILASHKGDITRLNKSISIIFFGLINSLLRLEQQTSCLLYQETELIPHSKSQISFIIFKKTSQSFQKQADTKHPLS